MSGFNFGASAAGNTFTFGSSSNNTTNANNANNANNSFAFGNSNANSVNNANTNNNSFMGGNNNQNTFNFGNTSNNNNNTTFNFTNPSNNKNSKGHNNNPMIDMQRLHGQYNPKNELCRFQSVLYNKIPSTMNVNLFNNKPPLIRSIIWDQGCKNNPYPKRLVPVAICGYDELNQRSNLCLAGHCSSIKRFQELSEKINIFKNEINIKTKQTIADLKQTQIHLSHRLLTILRAYINKITSNDNDQSFDSNGFNHFTVKEIKLKNVLTQMSKESKQLLNLYGHINKLSYDLDIESREKGQSNTYFVDVCNPNPQNMKQMFLFLKQQQQFLQLLSKTVQNDMRDLNIITNGITKQNSAQDSIVFNSFNNSTIFG